jgi:hypothetical protein
MRKSRKEKLEEAILNCYVELYENATPKADFRKLMEEAEINERGQKVINFMDYEIDEKLEDEIIQKHCSDKKLKLTKNEMAAFRNTIMLGCSPKTKRNLSLYE